MGHLVKENGSSDRIGRAKSLHDMGEIEAAISTLRLWVDNAPYSAPQDVAYELIIEWLLQIKKHDEAKRLASYFLAHHSKSASAKKIIELFNLATKPSDLDTDTPDEDEQDVVEERPLDHPSEQLKEIDELGQRDMNGLGILLPLSGPYAPFGKRTLLAMSIAWQLPLETTGEAISSFTKDGIRIVIADSKGDPVHASLMVEELTEKHRVAMIIGEITNEASVFAGQKCQQLGVPMLSLSRHPLVADVGDHIFVFNSSQSQQISRLVDHAINNKGHKRFGIFYPKNNYGMSMSKMFFDAVIEKGGSITAIESYDAQETTFTEPAKKLVGKFYLNARPEFVECEEKAKLESSVSKRDAKLKECRESIKPITDFEALFVPEFQPLAFVIPALIQEDMLFTNKPAARRAFSLATKIENPQYVQLLGANSWNDKATIDKIANQIDGAYFVDSVSFVEGDDVKNFAEAFAALGMGAATTLEVFAHDAAKFALQILVSDNKARKSNSRAYIRDLIAKFNGRVGLLKNIAFLKNGQLDAPEIGFEIVDGAARALTVEQK